MFRILFFIMLTGSCRGRIAEELLKEEPPLPAPVPPPPPPLALPSPPPSTPPALLCWSAPRELCPDGPLGCTRIDQSSVLCCDVDSFRLKEGLTAEDRNQTILNLHILNATLDELDVSQPIWRRLHSMSITDGNIKEIVGEFLRNSPASCLNISNNGIQRITTPRALVNLYKLTTLDMSKNNLKVMPNFNRQQNDFALDIKGNNEMLCKSVLDALERCNGHLNFINVNTTFCTSSKTFHWFNTTELVPVRQVKVIYELQYDCPDVSLGGAKCQCDMVRVDIVPGKPPTFSVGVDCSNRQLKELPNKLPPNTIQLNVSYNNITSLAPLIDHPSYEQMRELYADNNNIQSIVELEGTKFIDNFMILTLRANKLKSLPTYILSNTFDRNLYAKTIHLANNHLHCDCTSAKVLKGWLIDKTKYIPDYDQIYCENNQARVIDLIETKMCQQQRDWTDYIYYVIALEILLLAGLIIKVTYDYWVFKSVGYLPWPASKMPKLPCDWLCE